MVGLLHAQGRSFSLVGVCFPVQFFPRGNGDDQAGVLAAALSAGSLADFSVAPSVGDGVGFPLVEKKRREKR